MKEKTVHSFIELQNEIFSDTWNKDLMRYRDNRVYRGMGNAKWTMEPALNLPAAQAVRTE